MCAARALSDAGERVLAKLHSLGDIEAMPKKDWDAWLDALPEDEFKAFIFWYHSEITEERSIK